MIVGLVLAGGRSSRFGREKAMAPLHGRPLIAWAADALVSGVARLAVSAPPDSAAAAYACGHHWPVLADAIEGSPGPLAGVLAGLAWATQVGAAWLCTAPCDTPFLPADLVSRLAESAKDGASVARTADGLQPLCALWPVEALDRPEVWLGRGSPRAGLTALAAVEVTFEDPHAFANLNTPQDYAAAQDAAAARRVGFR